MTQRAEIMIARVERESLNYDECGRYRRTSQKEFGCSRSVWLYTRDRYVLKVNKYQSPDRDGPCAAEWEFYTSTTDDVRNRLAKPLYVSANQQAIAMELLTPCENLTGEAYEKARKERQELRQFFLRMLSSHAARSLMSDDGIFNFAFRNDGTFVLMDYGHLSHEINDEPWDIDDCYNWDFAHRLRSFMGCV